MSQKDKTIQTYKLVDKEIKYGTYEDQDIVDFNKSKVGKESLTTCSFRLRLALHQM